jgi:predicted metal-dependent hydrolase
MTSSANEARHAAHRAPAEEIVVRNLHFPLNNGVPQYWLKNSRSVTMFLDHLSLVFPPGERFFIQTVRAYESELARHPELREDARRFYQQEALHGREHNRYNEMLASHGYPVKAVDASAKGLLGFVSRILPRRMQLAVTCALEHFTALLAQVLLGDASILKGADPTMAALWRWHAAEENEHATVAYDVFQKMGGTYIERSVIMVLATILFWAKMFEHQVRMMHSQKLLFSLSEWAGLGRFFFGKRGVFYQLFLPYLAYFRPTFHPRDIDCSDLLARWRDDFEAMPMYRDHLRARAAA